VTEAQCGTIELHLTHGSVQAGGAHVSNRDLVGDPPVLTTGARWREPPRRMSPPNRPVDGAWTGTRMLPACACGRLSRPYSTPAAGSSRRTRSRMARLPRQNVTADVGMTRGKASKGMVVVDDDGIMFGARWYALTPCGTRSQFAALSLGSMIPAFP
jgi:hypothetical protein